ncbi:ABC transporter substrate-binding protein [Bifidobacterium imperatoris]|uniref:ABC transporter substrate-binding protein n=1 Tax=Bifidobacterium imperatoris TaxID=2020965 RepID=A0A2N5IUN4_9BIFI|nr:MetQ/NlpA family ABC transporter substrate-binding protein [Bifidobacterium imperatoris]PLS25656.1 ABC transporter substrate-binding protein [Bifidobacterium imperatoris]QSY57210.1 ABC transporter substrate-binding protein [Bifidobacterium imperatoris]
MSAATQTQTPTNPQEPVRVNHTLRNIIIAAVVVVLVLAGGFFGYRAFANNANAEKGSEANPVKIGVVGASDKPWQVFKQEALKQGIHVDIVDFQDYTSENPALDSGDLDLNEFQHLLYLANYNVKNNKDLQPIGGTVIVPLGLYSSKVKSVDEIKQGDTIAIPNDETNQARAIGVLQKAGLVTLKHKWTAVTAPTDIDESASKVKVVPLGAEKVANSLNDPQLTAGIINNSYIKDAGLNPKDAIFQDDPSADSAKPYINAFVARKADVNNPVYKKIVEIYKTKAVTDAVQEDSKGTSVLVTDYSAKELQGYLAQIESDLSK